MQKKKFDLTSDIVNVDLEDIKMDQRSSLESSGFSSKAAQKRNGVENKRAVLITISVDEEVRKEYKTWCAKRGVKMNEAFLECFELLKKQDY